MEESSSATATFRSETVLQEPCGLLLLLTILTWCVSRIQLILHPSSSSRQCSCNHDPSNKSTTLPPAPVLTGKQAVKTGHNKQDDEVTCEDIKIVTRSIGLSFDHDEGTVPSCGGATTGADYLLPRLFDDDEPSLDEVRQAFLVFDEDRDGYLDASDLLRVFRSLSLGEGAVGLGECEQMIAMYDLNMDGRIDLVEFTRVLEDSIC